MKVLFFVLTVLTSGLLTAQETDLHKRSKILKVSYTAYPISTYDTPPSSSEHYEGHSKIVSLAQSYQHKYSLYINMETNESIYELDTLIVNKKPGQEKMNFMINSTLHYVVKEQNGIVLKYEQIFQRDFYSNGSPNDFEWELTNETKKIAGMLCKHAVVKNKNILLNVWYTEEIPVAMGPVNYFGLPGLVVWSEDFFLTTEIEGVKYIDDVDFNELKKRLIDEFNKSKKGKEIKESLLIVKKAELVKSMISQMK